MYYHHNYIHTFGTCSLSDTTWLPKRWSGSFLADNKIF